MRLAIILFFTAALSLPAEIVTILPDSTTIAQGSDTQISIEISDLTTDLYAFQFDFVYAPAIDALDANEGAFLPGAGATLFILKTAVSRTSIPVEPYFQLSFR